MSLVNKMLRDLDARRAGEGERGGLPPTITPLSARQEKKSTPGLRQIGSALALVAVAAAVWFVYGDQFHLPAPSTAPASVAVVAAPAVTPVAAPAVPPAVPPMVPPVAAVEPPVLAPAAVVAAQPVVAPAADALKLAAELASPPVPRPPPDRKVAEAAAKKTEMPSAKPPAAKPVTPVPAPALTPPPAPTPVAEPPRVEKQMTPIPPAERAEVEYRRGTQAQRQGASEDALARYRAALGEHPEHAAARQSLAALLIELRRFDEAEDILRRGVALAPTRLASTLALARLKVERGQSAAALELLLANAEAGGRSADYQGFCAALLNRAGRYREAVERYQAATGLAPGEARWWAGLGIALEADSKPAAARDAYQRARGLPGLPAELAQHIDSRLR